MSTDMPSTSTKHPIAAAGKTARLLAILVMVAGVIVSIAGITTWIAVQSQLADEKITVSEDAARYVGEPVDGPLTAYEQARTIERHALETSDGQTYAELDREDPRRTTMMTASFLRASLFTSVVSFGVAAMATGLGIVIVLIGLALLSLARRMVGMPAGVSGDAHSLTGPHPPG